MIGAAHQHFAGGPSAISWHVLPARTDCAAVDLVLRPLPNRGAVPACDATDASDAQLIGTQGTWIDDHTVDSVEPAQRGSLERQHTMAIRKPATKRGRERLAAVPSGLRRGNERGSCGAIEVGRGETD